MNYQDSSSTSNSNNMSFIPRRVLITGAGSGIGRGIAEFLGSRGHTIYVSDLSIEPAQLVAESINKNGGTALPFALDAGNTSSIDSVFKSFPEPPNVLIPNAGLQHVSKLEDFPDQKFQQLLDVMLYGVAMLTKRALPSMREEGYGRVISIGSIHSVVASRGKSAYVAAKHGLVGFSKVMALETSDTDITFNVLSPSYVKTPLVEKQVADQAKLHGITEEEVVKNIMLSPMPKGNFIELDELAATAEFLMSNYAKNITAQTICLDGGWTAQQQIP